MSMQTVRVKTFFIATVVVACLLPVVAEASLHLGTSNLGPGGNDKIDDVVDVIEAYNSNNATSFSTNIMELIKTDDNPFSSTDFTFFGQDMTTVISAADVNTLPIAYFEYSGTEDLLYYSVKGDSKVGFSLYTHMAGKNLMELFGNNTKAISHVTFWKGPGSVPEPGSIFVWSLLALVCTSVSRRMQG